VSFRNLSFRARLTLVAATAVALAVLAASLVVFLVVRNQLRGQVDDALKTRAEEIVGGQPPHIDVNPTTAQQYLEVGGQPGFGGGDFVQAVDSHGRAIRTLFDAGKLPPNDDALAAANGHRGTNFTSFSDARIGSNEVRVFTIGPFRDDQGNTYALQVARSLGEVNRTLHRVTIFLILIAAGGIAIAGGLGLAVSQAALAPVRRLTRATEKVAETQDLSERIEANGEDELSRLAASFNTMLAALEESDRAKRQLVSDASHELRTPLTSLRTNIEVLARDRNMADDEREKLLNDVVSQLSEMTALVTELVELARGETHPQQAEDVRLDLLVEEVVARAQRDFPQVEFVSELEPTDLHGVPNTIARAVSNLLDNAAKWSPPGGKVEVTVRDGQVIVRDHGPGIEDDDLPHVFDRFYRAPAARKLPGSGLGLAIVKQVAEAHGGGVGAERAEGGGTRMRLRLSGANGAGPQPDRQRVPDKEGLSP
jgi:two-component system, OmpR family, sensor histidine kinase MprB